MRLIFLLLLALPSTVLASECFTEHITEALKQNRARRPLYAAITNRQSIDVSQAIINSEEWSYFYSQWMMLRTRDLRSAGIPIFCSEFVPMSLTPAFKHSFDNNTPPDLNTYQESPIELIETELNPHIENLNFEKIKEISLKWALLSYQEEPRFNCMTRHVLESIYATAEAGISNVAKARALNLEVKTRKFIKKFLESQIFGLPYVLDIDNKASKVQAQNVPIICNDVPEIINLKELVTAP